MSSSTTRIPAHPTADEIKARVRADHDARGDREDFFHASLAGRLSGHYDNLLGDYRQIAAKLRRAESNLRHWERQDACGCLGKGGNCEECDEAFKAELAAEEASR